MINWQEEVEKRKEDLLNDLFGLLRIESVKDAATKTEARPMGEKVGEALDYVLNLSEKNGFRTKNHDGYVGYAEHGKSSNEDYVGVLCHIDVMPGGSGWTTPAFEPVIRDGKIFARGSIDDKGPTMAAFYGLKIVKELGLEMKNNVRIIFGTDEESGMSCMRHYQQVEKMPALGFAPDADFPIINAEKGQLNPVLSLKRSLEKSESAIEIVSFTAGSRVNMVPDHASAILAGEIQELKEVFEKHCTEREFKGTAVVKDGVLELNLNGVSAHGMEPFIGVNAGTMLAQFLSSYTFQADAHAFIALLNELHEDFYGKTLGIEFSDEITGPLTVNPGVITFAKDGEAEIHLNIRCPVMTDYEQTKAKLTESAESKGFSISSLRESQPHHVDADHPMIKALQTVYHEETGEEPTLLSTGGATYARFMEKGVAFGACFPGKEMTAHQKDEYFEVEDLLKATAIYARAIYELANL